MPNDRQYDPATLSFQNATPLTAGAAMANSNPSGAQGWNPGQSRQIESVDLAHLFMQMVPHLINFGLFGNLPVQGTDPGQPTVNRMQAQDTLASQYTAERAQGDVDKAKFARKAAAKKKTNGK